MPALPHQPRFTATVTIDGQEIKSGDVITDFRGHQSVFRYVSRLDVGKPRLVVTDIGQDGGPRNEREYFPSVFNAVIAIHG